MRHALGREGAANSRVHYSRIAWSALGRCLVRFGSRRVSVTGCRRHASRDSMTYSKKQLAAACPVTCDTTAVPLNITGTAL